MAKYDYDEDDVYDSYDEYDENLQYTQDPDSLVYNENGLMIDGGDSIVQEIRAELDSRSDEVTDDQIQKALSLHSADVEKTVQYLFCEVLDREITDTACSNIMEALGDDSKYTTRTKVKSSLYYYYYDENKTFDYISRGIKTAKATEMKREAEGTSTNEFFFVVQEVLPSSLGYANPSGTCSSESVLAAQLKKEDIKAFFSDMPWLSVPLERQSIFIPPVSVGPVGLLGGSSKLKALAAQRKKQAPVTPLGKSTVSRATASASVSTAATTTAAASIDTAAAPEKPTLGDLPTASAQDPGSASQGTYANSTALLEKSTRPALKRIYNNTAVNKTAPPSHGKDPLESAPGFYGQDAPTSTRNASATSHVSNGPATVPATQPSAFAQTLFKLSPSSVNTVPQEYPMPYTASSDYAADAFIKPSPDDVVLTAQAQARKFESRKSAPDDASSTSDKPAKPAKPSFNKPNHKNIDVIAEYEHRTTYEKNRLNFVVTGHVDAGKSTLMGRLLLDLKEVDESLINRFRHEAAAMGKQSFALAWVMDQNAEERERGVTVDVTAHSFQTEKAQYTILDAPGHQAFVHNAIHGISQADFAILVLDGNTGAFEKGLKGSTYEHILLLRSLGIQRIVVAINKLDMVSWSQDRYDEIKEQISAFLYKFNFSAKNLQFVPISGLSGDNVVTRAKASGLNWYDGPTLVEALDNTKPLPRALNQPMRMMVSDLFSTGSGKLTVSGRLEVGTVQVGDKLMITSSNEACYVQSLLVGRESRDWAVAGENVDLVIVGVEATSVSSGDVLSAFDTPLQPKKDIILKTLAFQPLYPLTIDVHRGCLQCPGQINNVMAILDKNNGFITNARATRVETGEFARISVTVNQELPVEAGQRVVIRSGGHTIAAGVVE
ncbi:Elongation factor 1-alpha [Ceratocystis lukuohia]|uniref:Elongation factor 1-alpha n=1 Tax=Ceratocystis lukuohia TaxID=2019550 RepID=A0ABR4MKI8_9PEZI